MVLPPNSNMKSLVLRPPQQADNELVVRGEILAAGYKMYALLNIEEDFRQHMYKYQRNDQYYEITVNIDIYQTYKKCSSTRANKNVFHYNPPTYHCIPL